MLFLLCFAVVRCCVLCWFFFAFLLAFPWCSGLFLFLCSACAVLCWCACVVALCAVLSCPYGAGWCFVLLPVVFVSLLLGLAVLCCLLVGPGGSWCRVSVVCCGVSLGAVLRRVAAPCAAWRCVVVLCVVLFCSVWYCRALCRVLGRCPSSWGPVPSGAVFCVVSSRCACFAVVCCCVVLFAAVLCAVSAYDILLLISTLRSVHVCCKCQSVQGVSDLDRTAELDRNSLPVNTEPAIGVQSFVAAVLAVCITDVAPRLPAASFCLWL